MYTSYIGKKFLEFHNTEEKKNTSAKRFFHEVQFPTFFNSDKHLMHVHGSTFFQSISKEKIMESGNEPIARLRRLDEDIKAGKISGSTYVGYAAGEITAVTSGQLTNIDLNITEEDMYLSWIGQGFAIGLKGGLIFIDDEKIFNILYRGWKLYRKLLNQTPNLKSRQIETWNGQWLYYCSKFKSPDSIREDQFSIEFLSTIKDDGNASIETIPWVKILFALCKLFGSRTFTVNAFVSSKTNSTYGFVNLVLRDVQKLYQLNEHLFLEENSILTEEEIDSLSTFYSFNGVCKLGVIGLKAIEPEKLRDYMPKGSVLYAQGKDFKFINENSLFQYKLFKIWIIAMINKTELLKLATLVATSLVDFEKKADKGKTDFARISEEVRDSSNLRLFIEKLTLIMDKIPEKSNTFREVVEQALKMPTDIFPLFVTLIRFEYAFINSNND